MAKKPKPEGKKYSYMDTYGDLVTLLMCFFVLLFAMSTIEPSKYNAFAEALTNRFGPAPPTNPSWVSPEASSTAGDDYADTSTVQADPGMTPGQSLPAEFSQLAEAIEQFVEENGMQGEITVEEGESGTAFIRLNNNLLFEGNSSVLSRQGEEFVDFLGQCFFEVQDSIYRVQLMGHTAAIAGDDTDDSILAARRSGTVQSYLERSVGFSPYKMASTGYGRFYPIADNSDPATMPLNRRVDIAVIGNDPAYLAQALLEASKIYFPNDDTSFFEGNPEELPGAIVDDVPAVGEGIDIANMTDEQIEELANEIMEELE